MHFMPLITLKSRNWCFSLHGVIPVSSQTTSPPCQDYVQFSLCPSTYLQSLTKCASFANLVTVIQMTEWKALMNVPSITGPELSPSLQEWLNGYSNQPDFTLFTLETQLLSRYKYYIRNLLLYFPKWIFGRHSNCPQNDTQILLKMLLKFILAETNRAMYYLLTRGPLSQALSNNVHLCMSSCIFTYKVVKINTPVTNSSVKHFDSHQKTQSSSLSIARKNPGTMNTTALYSLYIN